MKCRYKIIKCLYVFSLIFVVLGIFLLVGTQTSKDNYMDDINSNTCLAYCKADFSTWDQINDLCCNSRLT